MNHTPDDITEAWTKMRTHVGGEVNLSTDAMVAHWKVRARREWVLQYLGDSPHDMRQILADTPHWPSLIRWAIEDLRREGLVAVVPDRTKRTLWVKAC